MRKSRSYTNCFAEQKQQKAYRTVPVQCADFLNEQDEYGKISKLIDSDQNESRQQVKSVVLNNGITFGKNGELNNPFNHTD